MEPEVERVVVKAIGHVRSALIELRRPVGKKANLNKALIELECADSVLSLISPQWTRRHRKGSEKSSEGERG